MRKFAIILLLIVTITALSACMTLDNDVTVTFLPGRAYLPTANQRNSKSR